jgi:hypothetical protein
LISKKVSNSPKKASESQNSKYTSNQLFGPTFVVDISQEVKIKGNKKEVIKYTFAHLSCF